MKIQVITLFPEMFEDVLNSSILGIAQKKELVSFKLTNLRDYGIGPRKQVDDTPYGGGNGMLLKPEPLITAIKQAKSEEPNAIVLLPTPRGKEFKQSEARKLSAKTNLIIVCPRYEGYDERVTEWVDEQFKIGDYILTGGEIPAMVIIDSVVRLIPGVLGNDQSTLTESFEQGSNIEHPQYTRPEEYEGLKVPDILLSGNHEVIKKWRDNNSK